MGADSILSKATCLAGGHLEPELYTFPLVDIAEGKLTVRKSALAIKTSDPWKTAGEPNPNAYLSC
jgi:hypothetical protein